MMTPIKQAAAHVVQGWQHARLLCTIFRYRSTRWLMACHDWVADHFLGFIITVFMGVIIPVAVVCFVFDWSPLVPQVLILGVFVVFGVLIAVARRHAQDWRSGAAVAAEAAYKRYRLRRQYPGLRNTPDSMLDDVFQPPQRYVSADENMCTWG